MDRPDHELPNDYLGIYSDFDDGEGEEGIEEGGFYDAWYSFVPPFVFWNSRLVASHSTRPHTRFSIVDY